MKKWLFLCLGIILVQFTSCSINDPANAPAKDKSSGKGITALDAGSTTFTVRIEAENYSAMSGIQTESCSEGTLDVGWIDTGDWMDYNVNIPAVGVYTLDLRVASTGTTGSLDFISGTTTLASIAIPNTGGWQNWTTVSTAVILNPSMTKVRLSAMGPAFNINWFQLTLKQNTSNVIGSGVTTIEAENYAAMSGIQTEACSEGTLDVGWIDNGDWMTYPITVNAAGSYVVQYRVASLSGGVITPNLDANATVFSAINVPVTGGWQTWTTISQTVTLPAGDHNFGINATAGGWNINWFSIAPAITGPAGYTFCAAENASFTLPGVCDVAYGANGSYNYLYGKTGTVTFNNAAFGDPLPNVVKGGYYRAASSSSSLSSSSSSSSASSLSSIAGWTTYGGIWSVSGNQYTVNSDPGAKIISNNTSYDNFVFEADVKVGPSGNAGLIFRVFNPGVGADTYNGYFAGIDSGAGSVFLGKANNSWTYIAGSSMAITANTFYHMKVVANGSQIQIYLNDMGIPKVAVNDTSFTSGAIGLRTYNAAAAFANITINASAPYGVTWPNGQFLPSFQPLATTMDVIDANGFDSDKGLMICTIQGLINRSKPRIYIQESYDEENNENWFSTLGVAKTVTTDPFSLVTKYRNEINGIVIFDPNLIDTRNVAVSVASVLGGIVVSPTLASTLQSSPYNLPVLMDLRGKFSSYLQAYQWLKDNYWGQLTHKAIFSLYPGLGISMVDYVMAVKGYLGYLNPDVSADNALWASMLADLPVNAPAIGWWNGNEQANIIFLAQHGHPGLGYDFMNNSTVYGGTPRAINIPAIPVKPSLQNKIYVTLIISDGDNLQADEHMIKRQWNDLHRGQVPIGWTLSPALVDAAPNILNYYWSHATANDCLISGPSGLGYTYPDNWNNDGALTTYVQNTASYMDKAGFKVITIWQNAYECFSGNAGNIFANNLGNLYGVTQQNDSPVNFVGNLIETGMATFYSGSEADMENSIASKASGWDGSRPRFITAQGCLWNINPTSLYNVMTALQSQNPNYVFVRPDHFFQLIKDAKNAGIPTLSQVFEAESQFSHGIGHADADGWAADTASDNAGFMMYGPYTGTLPAGAQKAAFRMLIDNNTANNDLCCVLDVRDNNNGQILATRNVYRAMISTMPALIRILS